MDTRVDASHDVGEVAAPETPDDRTFLSTIPADPAQLEASLINLATNARDAMPNGGRLTIRTANNALDQDYADQHAEGFGNMRLLSKPYRKDDLGRTVRDALDTPG